MTYLYATERPDYSDLASGRVFHSLPGHPAFPGRLASEIFQRCLALRERSGQGGRVALYDPCCGAGYLIAVLGVLHRPDIRSVTGSDIDPEAARAAGRNLALLEPAGLEARAAEIEGLYRRYGKESHREALESCGRLLAQARGQAGPHALAARAFQADALDGPAVLARLGEAEIDLVISDVPYGLHSAWQGGGDPGRALLEALREALAPGGLVAIASDKGQKFAHEDYQRVERFQVGKRRVGIFKAL